MSHPVTKRLCLVLAAPLLAATLHAQPNAPPPPLDLGLLTVSSSLSYFSGQTVRITNARIDRVISPRLFIVEPAMPWRSENWRMDNRALVVLATPTSTPMRRGSVVEIVGQPWSLYESGLTPDQAALADLKSHDARHFEYKPVIHADLVRTPGGKPLYGAR
jgi:hypothetical protein